MIAMRIRPTNILSLLCVAEKWQGADNQDTSVSCFWTKKSPGGTAEACQWALASRHQGYYFCFWNITAQHATRANSGLMCGVKRHRWRHRRPEVPEDLKGQLNQDTIYDVTGAVLHRTLAELWSSKLDQQFRFFFYCRKYHSRGLRKQRCFTQKGDAAALVRSRSIGRENNKTKTFYVNDHRSYVHNLSSCEN